MRYIISLIFFLCVLRSIKCLRYITFKVKFSSLYAGKGFGAPKDENTYTPLDLTPTRKTNFRSVNGEFSKILSKQSKIFEDMKAQAQAEEGTICNIADIYARLKNSNTFYFIGKVSTLQDVSLTDGIQLLYLLLCEYAKALRPKDLAGR